MTHSNDPISKTSSERFKSTLKLAAVPQKHAPNLKCRSLAGASIRWASFKTICLLITPPLLSFLALKSQKFLSWCRATLVIPIILSQNDREYCPESPDWPFLSFVYSLEIFALLRQYLPILVLSIGSPQILSLDECDSLILSNFNGDFKVTIIIL